MLLIIVTVKSMFIMYPQFPKMKIKIRPNSTVITNCADNSILVEKTTVFFNTDMGKNHLLPLCHQTGNITNSIFSLRSGERGIQTNTTRR